MAVLYANFESRRLYFGSHKTKYKLLSNLIYTFLIFTCVCLAGVVSR